MEPSPDQPSSPAPAAPPPGAHLTAPTRHEQPPLDAHAMAAASRDVVRRALQEDLGNHGDVTSIATIPADATGRADLVARADGVVAGTALVGQVYEQLDPRVAVTWQVREGDADPAGQRPRRRCRGRCGRS